MSKVTKIAVMAGLMATLGGRAYAAPINIDFNNGTFSNWTVVTGAAGFATVVNNAPSRRDLNTNLLSQVGDPADWISPLTNTNTPSCTTSDPVFGFIAPFGGRFAFLEAGPIPGIPPGNISPPPTAGASPNVYTSIVSNAFVADPFATLRVWAFFDALDQINNPWNDDGYARLRDLTTSALVGPVYAQSNSSMLCNQGSDASRWPHNSFPYVPQSCVQPFAGAMTFALIAGHSYQVEAGVRNGNPGDNDNTIPAALGIDAVYITNPPPPQVPEPSTLMLFGSGLGIALASYRRRRSSKTPKA